MRYAKIEISVVDDKIKTTVRRGTMPKLTNKSIGTENSDNDSIVLRITSNGR